MEGINNIKTSIAGLGRFRAYRDALLIVQMLRALRVTGSLRDQIIPASESIVLNLAEGAGDSTPRQSARYFAIARAR